MKLNLSTIRKHSIAASDGSIGTVSDVLFDDTTWMVRWLVVDTGTWLSGRKVLLPPAALGHPEPSGKTFPVRLTRAEIEASPELDKHRPVSRRFETTTYDYYGWSPYWGSGYWGAGYDLMGGLPMMESDPEVQRRFKDLDRRKQDGDEPHLRSAEEVVGYHIHAIDGDIGHLSDIMLEDVDWSIHYLIADTSNWWGGRQVLLSPRSVQKILWTERLVYLAVDRQSVKDSPPWDPAKPVDRAQARRIAGHYGKPGRQEAPYTSAMLFNPAWQ